MERSSKLQTLKPRLQTAGNRLPVMQSGSWRTDKQTSGQRGYDYRWQQRREQHLKANPLCVYCLRTGRVTQATVCDHIEAHRGDKSLFNGPIQSLCASCHSSVKATEEG